MRNLDSLLKSRDISLPTNIRISQAYGLPSGYVQLWELDHKECIALKNWCLQTLVLEKTPESFLDSREIKPANHKGYQCWIFTGRTDVEVETPVFWSSDANDSLEKSLMLGKKEGRRRRGSEGGLVWCSPWGHKESDKTGQLKNSNNKNLIPNIFGKMLVHSSLYL